MGSTWGNSIGEGSRAAKATKAELREEGRNGGNTIVGSSWLSIYEFNDKRILRPLPPLSRNSHPK